LLLWRAAESTLKRIESNGLLFGVNGNGAYPQREFPLLAGDRVLLYTDGVTEAENATQEAFAERKLEQVIRELQSRPASELSAKLLDEVRRWQAGPTQQDDITLLVVDVLE
jgi:sigma-B regulation protein RsbU (phosphoserine phosphatase)